MLHTVATVPPAQSPNPQTGVALSSGVAESGNTSSLTVGSYSYEAHYNGDSNFNSADATCETLTVKSSISDFHYNITNGSNYGNPSGPWYCHTDDSTTFPKGNGPDPATCPSSEGNVQVSTKSNTQTNSYLVTVQVADSTGGSIYEKVQGGLAASAVCYADSNGNCYTPVNNLITIKPSDITLISGSGSCSAAVVNLSSAKTGGSNTGNVVIWGDGTTSTNQKGFAMSNGQLCQLQVMVKKAYSSTSDQAVSSSWSEQQTGPGKFSGGSPYTGQLLVKVKP